MASAPIEESPKTSDAPSGDEIDPLLACLKHVIEWHGLSTDSDSLLSGLPLENGRLTPELLLRSAHRAGLRCEIVKRRLKKLPSSVLPAILLLKNNRAGILEPDSGSKDGVQLVIPNDEGATFHAARTLKHEYAGFTILVRPGGSKSAPVATRPEFATPEKRRWWFWRTMWSFRNYYIQLLPGSLLVNFFALAMPFFIMIVYDRVVPNNAEETLWVLAIGVATVFIFEYLTRLLRGHIVERAGREIDQVLSSSLYEQILAMEMQARPASAGNLTGRAKAYEVLREFFMSASMLALADVPFGLLMIAVIFFIGGPVGWVLVLTSTLAILMGCLIQAPLRKSVLETTNSNVERQAFVAETINGLESVKGSNAEGALQQRMERMMQDSAAQQVRSHWFALLGSSTTTFLIHLTTVGVIVVSVYRVHAGEMSMGAMIACVLLAARAMAPLAMVAGLMTRLQQALESLRGLNQVMRLPRETGDGRQFLQRSSFHPNFELKNVQFAYPEQQIPAIKDLSLAIRPGERIAILGRIGSGKSTLLRLLAKLYDPSDGTILLDEIELHQYHPSTLRRGLGYLPQDPTLFYGTLRENILLGHPAESDSVVWDAARVAGLESTINSHPMGVHLPVGERGVLLSGGQRQAVALARALVGSPQTLLLDEPTAAMDLHAEKHVITKLKTYLDETEERGLVMVTHKLSMLEMVDRIVVIEAGQIVTDGTREEVLQNLRNPKAKSSGAKPGPTPPSKSANQRRT